MRHTAATVLLMALYSTAIMRPVKRKKTELCGDSLFDAGEAERIDASLSEWFALNQRDLTFRKSKDPYAVMLAEFMLQQTTAATVQGYFPRFLERFPKVEALAAAAEDDVMAMWAGMGYYRRARQLHAAAKMIVDEFGGKVPMGVDELQKLPGIGRYTAGAISSAAFDEPAPILETNTVRVFARLAGIDGVVGEREFMVQLWQVAGELVRGARSPRVFNIAAMELGALVCRPQPKCDECSMRVHCRAFAAGVAGAIPRRKPSRERVDVYVYGFVFVSPAGEFLVRRIPTGEWHAGMWEFPTARMPDSEVDVGSVAADLLAETGFDGRVESLEHFKSLRYQVTHHRVHLRVWQADVCVENGLVGGREDVQFLPLAAISVLPMGSAQQKLLSALIETESSCRR